MDVLRSLFPDINKLSDVIVAQLGPIFVQKNILTPEEQELCKTGQDLLRYLQRR